MVVMHVTLWHYTNVCTLLHGSDTTYTNYEMHGIINVCHTTYVTGFAKMGLVHASKFSTSRRHNLA